MTDLAIYGRLSI